MIGDIPARQRELAERKLNLKVIGWSVGPETGVSPVVNQLIMKSCSDGREQEFILGKKSGLPQTADADGIVQN